MKRISNRASVIAIIAIIMLGCKSKNEVSINPLLEPGSASTPEWKYEPSRQTYGSMTAIVVIPDLFADYLSAGDKMAIFGPDGKVLCSATPLESDNNRYLLYIEQPAEGTALKMQWYCDKLHRIYEAKSFPDFVLDATLGVPDPIIPDF